MIHYLFKSIYRLPILGLILGVIGIWVLWLKTEQLTNVSLVILTSGITVLNIILGYFSFSRSKYIANTIFLFSYGILLLLVYSIYIATRGIY